jgi:hypothetical protein
LNIMVNRLIRSKSIMTVSKLRKKLPRTLAITQRERQQPPRNKSKKARRVKQAKTRQRLSRKSRSVRQKW